MIKLAVGVALFFSAAVPFFYKGNKLLLDICLKNVLFFCARRLNFE